MRNKRQHWGKRVDGNAGRPPGQKPAKQALDAGAKSPKQGPPAGTTTVRLVQDGKTVRCGSCDGVFVGPLAGGQAPPPMVGPGWFKCETCGAANTLPAS